MGAGFAWAKNLGQSNAAKKHGSKEYPKQLFIRTVFLQ